MDAVQKLMSAGVSSGVFPGAVLLLAKAGKIVFHEAFGKIRINGGQVITKDTVFDLASLTKPIATASIAMVLVQQKKIWLDQTLGKLIPEFDTPEKKDITIKQILSHTAGFSDYQPYYMDLAKIQQPVRRQKLLDMLVKEPLSYKPGQNCIYSDIGYMALGFALEQAAGKNLDILAADLVFSPLGIKDLFFMPFKTDEPLISKNSSTRVFAATENCPWRKKILQGQVHDDNAWVLGGVAGHAGLFGTASGVWRFLEEILNAYKRVSVKQVFEQEVVQKFILTRQSPGAFVLGYDTPTLPKSSSGACFSASSIGHLGYTGTSFWLDLEKEAAVVLLTNRVHPTRENEKIKAFRPRLHNMAMKAMGF